MNLSKIEKAISEILLEMNVGNSEVLSETPRRVAKMYKELLRGQSQDPSAVLKKTFPVETNDIVLVKDIYFSSLCEHHLLPFFGKVSIAYIPNGRVVGLSKLGRVVDIFSHRLQIQERLTTQICGAIFSQLKPQGVMVIIKALHTCMVCRGVEKHGSETISLCKMGDISEQQVKMMLGI